MSKKILLLTSMWLATSTAMAFDFGNAMKSVTDSIQGATKSMDDSMGVEREKQKDNPEAVETYDDDPNEEYRVKGKEKK